MLEYGANLELSSEKKFFFEISPQHLIQFQLKGDKISGSITRGYMFQKIQDFSDLKIHEVPRLFWPLKRHRAVFSSPETLIRFIKI
jgi:hypothetical protein